MIETRQRGHDKELIRARTMDVLACYLNASGKDQGSRVVWDCPSCGRAEKFSVKKAEKKGGCLVAGCRMEGYEDVFSLVARFEDLDYRTDFLRVLEKAGEALGFDPGDRRPDAQNGPVRRQERHLGEGSSARHSSGSAHTVSLRERAAELSYEEKVATGGARTGLAGTAIRARFASSPLGPTRRSWSFVPSKAATAATSGGVASPTRR